MYIVKEPAEFNETWASLFNEGNVDNLLCLYEDEAVLSLGAKEVNGKSAIREELAALMEIPGRLEGKNHFCLVQGDLALLRADWRLIAPDGSTQLSGSSAELLRRQPDGRWLYVIDHASGSSAPSVL